MSWKKIVKEFDEHGRDFDEQGLDGDGKPIPKNDEFLRTMKRLVVNYEKTIALRASDREDEDVIRKRQRRIIFNIFKECQDELEERKNKQ